MRVLADRAHDVAAVELHSGEKIERRGEQSYPGGAADGMKKKRRGFCPVVKDWREEVQD